MNAIFRYRDGFALGPAMLMLAGLHVLVVRPTHVPLPATQERIEFVMLAPPTAAPPVRPPEPSAQSAVLRRHATQTQTLTRDANVAIPATTQDGEVSLPVTAPEPTEKSFRPDHMESAPSRPAFQAPQPHRAHPADDIEAAYVAQVQQMLNAIKRYPTGREASLIRPSGMVRVWLVLNRDGQLLGRGIESSSQSLLLDGAALRTVSVGHYPPFPAELWPGQAQRRFHVDINFIVPNS